MTGKNETEILRSEVSLLRRQLTAHERMLDIASETCARQRETARIVGDELRALQAQERKNQRALQDMGRRLLLALCVGFLAAGIGITGLELVRLVVQ